MNRFQQCLSKCTPYPGPKRPIRIRYAVMSVPILELSAVLYTVRASVLFRPF